MSIYLIEKPQGRKAYYSFSRLVKEEDLERICKLTFDKVPEKNDLPVSLAFNQIKISKVEVDERL